MENDEQIDFLKLEKEFSRAVEADAKYQRENAAKFRAVEQRVGSYEEFKDIVAASHLKPLEKKDKLGQEKFKQPWNSLASAQQKSEISASNPPSGKEKQSKCPKAPHNFTKTWKHELKTAQDRFDYLCQIGGQHLGQLFKAEVPMGLFGEIVEVLNTSFQPPHCDIVIDILNHLSTTNRFNLTAEFLSSKEKDVLKDLFRKINDVPCDDSQEKRRDGQLKELIIAYKVNL
ncbi:coiled-coil domain-containing protein 103 [Exaiptasia diaphana]|uniref:Coiled-coil domain-containing protein 103 n=1 Tax=Exaiptasia diaphana TaxID=2652724 RepID=A0A913XEC0_EXADI|nr:coiled-coil domain-containing protein 103 [Exaiptasia diaphana]KXJ12644.1 Coiled-coil domain-containing protein 103 [Exaiptasia diaphana]